MIDLQPLCQITTHCLFMSGRVIKKWTKYGRHIVDLTNPNKLLKVYILDANLFARPYDVPQKDANLKTKVHMGAPEISIQMHAYQFTAFGPVLRLKRYRNVA